MNVFDPYSSAAVFSYLALLAGVLAFTWPVRMFLSPGPVRVPRSSDLHPYELAYLTGGGPLLVHAALAALAARGCVRASERERSIQVAGPPPEDLHPVEEAVYHALCTCEGSQCFGWKITEGILAQVKAVVGPAEEEMDRLGLRFSDRRVAAMTRAAVTPLLVLALAGFLVAVSGTRPGDPPVPMSLLCGLTLVLAAGFALFKPRLTPAGRGLARGLAKRRRASLAVLRGPASPPAEVVAAVAVTGLGAAGGGFLAPLALTLHAPAVRGEPEEAPPEEDPAGGLLAEGDPVPDGHGPYGYVVGALPRGCWMEDLAKMCREGRTPRLVWTPHAPVLQHPTSVPALFTILKKREVDRAFEPVVGSRVLAALFVFFWLVEGKWFPSFWLVLVVVTAIQAWPEVRELRGARRLTPEQMRRPPEAVRLSPWALQRAGKEALYTHRVTMALVAVGIVQLLPGLDTISAAGLVKEAVRQGEWWRLLTAATLHANPLHFVFNWMACVALGEATERYGRRVHLPFVLVLAALAGNVASLYLTPGTSVGASGAIMGLVGYQLVLGWRFRAVMPPRFFRLTTWMAASTALVGAVGYGVIDNAAHGGGLLAGLVLGAVLVPSDGPDEREEPDRTTLAGWACMVPFLGACLLSVVLTFTG